MQPNTLKGTRGNKPDKVELYVGKMRIDHFLSYQISADLYTPADAFQLELANPEIDIKPGLLCELYINDQKELTGLIDNVSRKIIKNSVSLSVSGRDLMGLVIDSYCEPPYFDITNMKLQTLAERLLAKVPFIQRKDIKYQDNVVGKLKGKKKAALSGFLSALDTEQKIGQIEAGMTIFEVLKNYSLSRGMLFYCEPDGTLVFGRPMAKGAPEYTLQMIENGVGNNVIESNVVQDTSKRYSKVIVIGQQQGAPTIANPTGINTDNVSTPAVDASFPFAKVYVARDNNDNVSPAMRARMILEKQRREGTQLVYTVARHNQNGRNWQINNFCHVKDDKQSLSGKKGIDQDFLIYGRTFELNKQSGPITKLRLGEPGLVA